MDNKFKDSVWELLSKSPYRVKAIRPRIILQNVKQKGIKHYPTFNPNKASDLEVFVHVSERGAGVLGHVDICYQGTVYSYGNYDATTERRMGMLGEGVLMKVSRETYIDFCHNYMKKTLFVYGFDLSSEQHEALQKTLAENDQTLVPWHPDDTYPLGHQLDPFSIVMHQDTDVKMFKFTNPRYQPYHAFKKNCVFWVNDVLVSIGLDMRNGKTYMLPGQYQWAMDDEYNRGSDLVTKKTIYQPKI